MEKDFEKETSADRLGKFILKNRKVIVSAVCVVAVLSVGYGVSSVVMEKNAAAGLAKVDAISFQLTNKSDQLTDDEMSARLDKALSQLQPLVSQKGVVGSRANLVAGNASFIKKDWESARSYYLAVVSADKDAYTAPIAYYKAAVCSEELHDADAALKYYQIAADADDFEEESHALFNIGRIKETRQDYTGAADAYRKLIDKNMGDTWSALAKTQMIKLQVSGKVQ